MDLAVIVVPAKAVPKVLEECSRKKVKGVIIISSGFGEIAFITQSGVIRAKDTLKLGQHKQQGLRSITFIVILVVFAILFFALTALKHGMPELMLKAGTFVYR